MSIMPEHSANGQRGDADALALRRRISHAHYATLGELFDVTTFRHLEALGLRAGWRCWEVGAGGPTVPTGLADWVGPTGQVLATDIDVSALEEAPEPGFEILRHDVAAEPAPRSGLDLVHARLVLMHVADRDAALTAMAAAGRLDLATFTVVSAWGRKAP
jgi:hypothetical protein